VVDLIQGYDEYVMSYKESKDVLRLPGGANTILSGEPIYMHAISSTATRPVTGNTSQQEHRHHPKPNSIGADQSGVESARSRGRTLRQFLGQPAGLSIVLTD